VIIARVVGNVVATQKEASHEGKKILLIQPLDLENQPMGDAIVALDAVDAGVGDRVLAVQEGLGRAYRIANRCRCDWRRGFSGVRVIAHLRGKLAQKEPARVIVDVNGVGYEVFIPLTTFTALPSAGSDVSIDVHTHVREDMIALYGFSTRRERTIFEKLMTISGIGPKLAVTILSGGSVEDLVGAIRRADLARLTAIPGVGRKTAERIILELKDKLQDFAEAQPKSSVEVDVLSALENLGYNRALAEGALRRVMNGDGDLGFEVLFKRSLQILTKG
jgi:holliday junction DNA helicase RuvA